MLHVLRPLSVCLLSVTLCVVAKRCDLEQKLLLTAYRSRIWEIDWYQDGTLTVPRTLVPWRLFRGRIMVMSTIALHSTLNISEMAYRLSNGHVTDNVTWPQRRCEAVRSAILARAWLLVSELNVVSQFRRSFITNVGSRVDTGGL